MKYRLNKLSKYLRGWMGYFGISEQYRDIPEIDGWIRRRVRLCYWKQWRWCRTKIRNLLKLGVQLGTSIRAGLNRGGPWAMSRRLAAQHGMTNKWLKDQGLISVKELWVKTSLPGYGPVTSANRPVRTRMPGGVGGGGEKPPLTRLSTI